MSKFIRTFLIGAALLSLASQVHAQANDVDCIKCVDTKDIAREAVNTYKIKPKAVTTDKLAKQAVTTSKLAPQAVTTGKIKNGAVTENKLSGNLLNAMLGSRLPRVLDGGDNEIGLLVSIGENHWTIEVITQQGYLLTVSPRDGMIMRSPLYFASSDCTGTGYIDGSFFGGYVTSSYDLSGVLSLVYVDKNSLPLTNFSYASLIFYGDGCFAQVGQQLVFPVLPNDPNVTGVSAGTYQLPIKIQHPQ